ncbi:hypothetical protein [Aquimarina pacifica]|uniref:hypothetical protein n=1 Tax=Aquimarina pacifica TaxID=1296415 RepID=UPI000471F81D|nr:hypothetical protein [Aquimarina pacifica]
MKPLIFNTLLYFILFTSCKTDVLTSATIQNTELHYESQHFSLTKSNDSLNISILLDVSDRINKPYQIQNDLAHIQTIAQIFEHHVLSKKTILLNDHLQLFFEPNPSPEIANKVASQLKVSVTRMTIDSIKTISEKYTRLPPIAYKSAQQNPETQKGADIWRFFKDKVYDYCIEKHHRNILIILTDGYLFHKDVNYRKGNRTTRINQKLLKAPILNRPNWKDEVEKNNMGILWEGQSTLQNLEVLILGIDKHNTTNPHAEDIIKYYWEQWFREMGIQKFKIKSSDTPVHLEKVIYDFIHNA